jgi:hypothetical protein
MPKKTTSDRPELNPVNVSAAAVDISSRVAARNCAGSGAVIPTATPKPSGSRPSQRMGTELAG